MPSKPNSVRLLELAARLVGDLSEDDHQTIAQAVVTAQRLEAGEGFSVSPVVSHQTGHAKVDVVWMGMMAQTTPEQARSIGAGLFEAAAEAESDASVVAFLRRELQFDEMQAAAALGLIRKQRQSLRQTVVAETQEPSSVATMKAQGSKPS